MYLIKVYYLHMKSLLIVFICFSYPVFAQLSTKAHNEVAKVIQSYKNRSFFAGNILIHKNGERLFESSTGMSNREWEVQHEMDSKFMIASISKQFTAALILKLQELGQLSIEDKVASYLGPNEAGDPDHKWDSVRIRHLLTHTGGIIRDVGRTKNYNEYSPESFNYIVSEQLRFVKLQVAPPGETFRYSNVGYLLLAKIIEKVQKKTYEQVLKNLILRPLEMNDTQHYSRGMFVSKLAEGYYYNDVNKIAKRCCRHTNGYTGSHSLVSTALDLSKWAQELLKPSGKALTPELVHLLTENHIETRQGNNYGFGLYTSQVQNKKVWEHEGWEYGYVSHIFIVPELNLSIIVLANSHSLLAKSSPELSRAIFRALLNSWQEKYVDLPTLPMF